MLAGAFAGAWGAAEGGWGAGIVVALLAGAALGALMAATVLWGGANQLVVGLAISLLATGVVLVPVRGLAAVGRDRGGDPAGADRIGAGARRPAAGGRGDLRPERLHLRRPGLRRRGRVGAAADRRRPGACALSATTRARQRCRACRCGACGRSRSSRRAPSRGVGGATLTVGYLGSFSEGVTAGRGYVALAAVIIGRWSPRGAIAGAGVFALFDSLALQAQRGGLLDPGRGVHGAAVRRHAAGAAARRPRRPRAAGAGRGRWRTRSRRRGPCRCWHGRARG